ncbi:uncharacterized protein BT62DRAFT_927053 [Guyanagaster necrorhizus]|uniref:Uncharacterized protein n=1 Tax=Guyanagaster necrorhizus TaxID=856835 RepID=A0A9P7W3M2_9AGAR|nr:uncharacterized protein BT62DRAFT_927053 [Guyanagaster necrorhizus MCA 3950]KAG7451365.1 hypothetical protein BT62DRAFT_927053 [Guyanagaster necrorhizus MCA 3950]
MAPNPFNIDEVFYESCLDNSRQFGNQSRISSTSTLVSPTAYTFGKREGGTDSSHLTDHYPAAYKDFFGMPSGAPCIYKSGPAWPECTGPQTQRFIREARPVYGHPIAGSWLKIGTEISKSLDSRGIMWTSIDPVAFANAGEKTPFCPLLMWIGVKHKTLPFDVAVAAADAIKVILSLAGFPEIEVAFRESEVTHSVGGPKLLPFNPLLDSIPEFRKPFTPTLGLSIAPLKMPHYEGTGALYFHLGKDDDERVVLLTAAHVARPPPAYAYTGMSRLHPRQRHEYIVALGSMGYGNATNAMMTTIGDLARSIEVWNKVISRLGEFVEGEDAAVTDSRKYTRYDVERATRMIDDLNKFHDEVTKRRTHPNLRIIGFVLHAEPIVVADGPIEFTRDWAFIQLFPEKINWSTFPGNKVYIGGSLSPSDFGKFLFSQPEDQAGYEYPVDGLLQAFGVVKDDEIRQPQHLDIHGEKALLVVKNGQTTGTTIGRVNGLESFTRVYTTYGVKYTSIEVAILPYTDNDKLRGPFSAPGDSGAIILDRAGRIVALLTGGGGTNHETDVTYGTPYWWLEKKIKKAFPDCHLY